MTRIVVIGAGIGGLTAAMRLAHAGLDVTVLDAAEAPGGKMRTVPSAAGPVDAGPTVLTLRDYFAGAFDASGASLEAEVSLTPLDTLARHHWNDGSPLDLHPDADRSRDAIGLWAGAGAARDFARFDATARALFDAFEGPMMRAVDPAPLRAAWRSAVRPATLPPLRPGLSLAALLRARFRDRRLQQLFGRYATYVGGDPRQSPAVLSVIWHAESRGVWAVEGGMHALAHAMRRVAERAGAAFRFGTKAGRIVLRDGRVTGVLTDGGEVPADVVVHNGDPNALRTGLLGDAVAGAALDRGTQPRSLSAFVWSFAARAAQPPGQRHSVFFARDPEAEFEDIARGRLPRDPTLYVHAQDHGHPPGARARYEIIVNGPPRRGTTPDPEEATQCQRITFDMLDRMGLRFAERPDPTALTAPEDFGRMFPGSMGSLYGRSPHGTLAPFHRPRARTKVPGLYQCGGGIHPGPGIPMASLSGQHAAAAIMRDRASTRRFRPAAMVGGTSTA
ncbi:1-hydroxycarotenoid 3,4-desaturase CrtD [Jannaschia sp. LMIT008]|uniref:1-hydroxycarotenoid 3,4-desaturase CrtD n=1 Tax=Jannaschia maritima TaxID=3032585 RepID=UPI002811C9E8|nr:1-hydroxycarotenoid 3,4-desaturase CrtD [Jannaschia sp. LMIT008]